MKIHALAGATALVLVASPALADASPFMDLAGSVFSAVLWPVMGVAGSIATYIVGRAVMAAGSKLWDAINRGLDAFEKKTGIEVDAKNREALHSALETGLQLALKRGAPVIEDAVAAWVKASVPGAIAHFGLSQDMLDGLVDAKMGKAATAAVGAPLALPGALLSGLAEAGGDAIAAPLAAFAAAPFGRR